MPITLPEFLLQFFFTLAVTYGALQMSKVMGSKPNMLVAIVLGFFAVSNQAVVDWVNAVLPYAAIFFVVVFFLGFLFSVISKKAEEKDYTLIIIVAALILLFLAGQGWELVQDYVPNGKFLDAENFAFLAGLILVILILFAAYRREGGN